MSAKMRKKPGQSNRKARARQSRSRYGGKGSGEKVLLAVLAGVGVLAAIFFLNNRGGGGGGGYPFQVGRPGPGDPAPPIELESTAGTTFDLAATGGKTVLLYFQEGVGCQPCWDQIVDIEKSMGRFRALAIDEIVSITTNPMNVLRQKVADQGISIPVLSDPDVAVSRAYSTNQYRMSMMSERFNGHSFILVGPDGRILWRADYGGPPHEFMYIPIEVLLKDIGKSLGKA